MKKRPFVALLNSIEAGGAQVITNATSREWSVVTLSTNKENLIGPIPYGKGVRVEYFDPQAEVRQVVTIGDSTTKETIVASTRYRIEIGNPEHTYETTPNTPKIFAYTSAATLSGTAATDRAVVYRALRDRINSASGVHVTAYTLTYAAFTLGTSNADAAANFIVGELVTQETSGLTARVAKCTITAGTFAADNAAGHIWLYNLSTETGWLETAKTLTAAGTVAGVSTNCVVTVTNATTVHATGLAILDAAGYFTSALGRGGKSYVGLTQGFSTDSPVVARAAEYAMGIGSVMAALKPVFDDSKVNLIAGSLEYDFQAGTAADTTKTYTKCVITTKGQTADPNGMLVEGEREYILYVDNADADLADFKTALTAAVAL
jgi:hypothetical protein